MIAVSNILPLPNPPLYNYGVHTSLKIPPMTWFRYLILGCAIAFAVVSRSR